MKQLKLNFEQDEATQFPDIFIKETTIPVDGRTAFIVYRLVNGKKIFLDWSFCFGPAIAYFGNKGIASLAVENYSVKAERKKLKNSF